KMMKLMTRMVGMAVSNRRIVYFPMLPPSSCLGPMQSRHDDCEQSTQQNPSFREATFLHSADYNTFLTIGHKFKPIRVAKQNAALPQ
ncbi:MAG: hypothetical protein OXF90_01435, partial [Chloroflexi bacterium]|nr:hypothetical protein [Chloroflexota bacterium]